MVGKKILLAFSIILLMVCACKDDAEITSTIVGNWNGTTADFKINPSGVIPAIGLPQEELPVKLQFTADNKVVLTDNKGVSENGTYQLSGDKLTVNIDYTFELIGLSGVYTVKELSSALLVLEIEKDGNYTLPETGQQINGTVVGTLNFSRSAN